MPKQKRSEKNRIFELRTRNSVASFPCPVFMNGKGSKGNKQPYAIYPLNDDYFGFAGLWEKREALVYVVKTFWTGSGLI